MTVRAGLDLDADGTWEHTSNDAQFKLEIRACQIENVNIVPINPRKYMVSKPELEIQWYDFVQDPACNYYFDYRFYLIDVETGKVTDLAQTRPDWLRMWIEDPNELKYKIETSDNDFAGKYQLKVEAHFLDKYWLPSAKPAIPPTLTIDLEIYSNLI